MEQNTISTALRIDVRIEMVTPDKARQMLEANTSNRKVTQALVYSYAKQMENGTWPFTAETIIFGKSGKLLDGQHRLLAVVKSQTSQPFLIARGIENEDAVFAAIDSGKNRSAADVLSKEGFADATLYASTVRRIILYYRHKQGMIGALNDSGRLASNTLFVTNNDVREWAEQNDISGEIAIGRSLHKKSGNIAMRTDFTFYYWLFAGIDTADALDFLGRLATGLNLTEKSPIYALRRRLDSIAKNKTQDPRQKHWLFIRAWNDFRKGRQVSHYVYSKDSEIPSPV